MWWGQHRTCPTCKTRLKSNDFHQISYKPKELVVQEERSTAHIAASRNESKKMSIYSDISSGVLRAIRDIDLDGSFGTKVDTLCRHIIWLRENDPGAKSIVFSQYKEFLGVLAAAFSRFDIGFSSVDGRGGIERFKSNPSVRMFSFPLLSFLLAMQILLTNTSNTLDRMLPIACSSPFIRT